MESDVWIETFSYLLLYLLLIVVVVVVSKQDVKYLGRYDDDGGYS